MTDAALKSWWPELGTVVEELRRIGRANAAQRLADAPKVLGSSTEILWEVHLVLREYRPLRGQLGEEGKRAWDAMLRDAYRAFPGLRFRDALARLVGR